MAFTVTSLGSTIQGDDVIQASDTWTNRSIPAGTQAVVFAVTYREGSGNGGVSSVIAQDSGGANPENFVKIGDYRAPSGGYFASLWYLVNPTSGTRDIAITWAENINDSYYAAAAITDGLDTSDPLDASVEVDDNDGIDLAVTTTTDNAAVFCVIAAQANTGPFTPPAGWTELADLSGGTGSTGDVDTWFGWIEAGAAGPVEGKPAEATGQVWAAVIAAFKAASGGTNATATPDGVSGTASVGSVQVNLSATVSLTGVEGTGSVGTASVSTGANDNAAPDGVAGTGAVGTVTVSVSVTATVTGVTGTGQVGSLTVATTGDATAEVTGVSASGEVGTVTIAGIAEVAAVSGLEAVGSVGTVTILGWLTPPPASNDWSGEGSADDIWTPVAAASGDWS